jgi:hypothetical protein
LSDTRLAWPEGFDVGVALAIRDIGRTFKRGVSRVSFTLNHRTNPLTATLDSSKFAKIRARLAETEAEIISIEGRLMMVDLKESRPKFRVDRAFGTSIICAFGDEVEFKISEFLKSYVRVQGRAEYNAEKEITRFQVLSIEKIGEGEAGDLTPFPPETPRFDPDVFWRSKGVDELSEEQGLRFAPGLEKFKGGAGQRTSSTTILKTLMYGGVKTIIVRSMNEDTATRHEHRFVPVETSSSGETLRAASSGFPIGDIIHHGG